MRNMNYQLTYRVLFPVLLTFGLSFFSCTEQYDLDEIEPEWLGASIYDYLNDTSIYTNYVKLIEDVGYKEILGKTGSKTLFIADDEAFNRFFADNNWGVSSYEDLSLSQKKLILLFGMINNAYLLETLANYYGSGGLNIGTAFRRSNAVNVLDTIPFRSGADLPSNSYFDPYRSEGIYLLDDDSPPPMVHFLPIPLLSANISDDDFELIMNVSRTDKDAYIFDKKVVERDITCKNGYIHVLEDVLVPRTSMAQYISENDETTIFAGLLNRFTAPYYSDEQTMNYKAVHPEFSDSIFVRKYFSSRGGRDNYPNTLPINDEYLLPFSPGWNGYEREGIDNDFESDMAAVLAPTDLALEEYFNTGKGIILKERYGSWENVPDDIIILFLKRHLRSSFLETIPSRFDKMTDEENSPIPVTIEDLDRSYVAVNGVVYLTKDVFPPDDYVSVYGPVLFSESTKVFNWAIRKNDFRLYLNSLLSIYSFFVPTDEYFDAYLDPIAWAKDVPAALQYWYNEETSIVNATVYAYDKETGSIGDEIAVIEDEDFISNRLLDLLDTHIFVGDVEDGSKYYLSKGGNPIVVEGSGEDLKAWGGGDIQQGVTTNVVSFFDQENGKTYFIDKPIQTPLQSVYKVLSETESFNAFFQLVSGFPSESEHVIFKKTTNYYGIDFNIKFFNTFNYTVYVPTNEAIDSALSKGYIKNWSMINELPDGAEKDAEIEKLARFLRYHFQDNSVFFGSNSRDRIYQTATIKTDESVSRFNTFLNKYYKLGVEVSGDGISLTTELNDTLWTANVITDEGQFNIMTRDYIFNSNPLNLMEIDGTGSGTAFINSEITTSSTAVIHQIDNVLRFE